VRESLADAFGIAAGKLENGVDRLLVDEYLRTAIARQPTSGQWANEFTRIIPPNPTADALRKIAKGLRQ
jgi:hypothetical protein